MDSKKSFVTVFDLANRKAAKENITRSDEVYQIDRGIAIDSDFFQQES
jgi:hypothetical protein